VFYETLDQYRNEVLENEYHLRDQMNEFEDKVKYLIDRSQKFTITEFFFEQH